VLRLPALILVLVLALAVPGSAFGQTAGDDQYQDPFGDSPAQSDDGGLSTTPPGGGDSGDSGSSGSAPETAAPAPETSAAPTAAAESGTLPNTGSDARLLALLAVSMLMVGVGLRLRTIDPDSF
jgi:LPXTG-motif cell wall-anchored protein